MRKRLIALAIPVLLIGAALAATLLQQQATAPDAATEQRSAQHEYAAHVEDLPERERSAAQSVSIAADTFATHLPLVSIETGGQ